MFYFQMTAGHELQNTKEHRVAAYNEIENHNKQCQHNNN